MKHAHTNTIVGTNVKFEFGGQRLWFWKRASPRRKPGEETATVVFHGFGHMSMPRKTSPARARRRLEAKGRYAEGILRDHEVGTNPVYRGHPRGGAVHRAWKAAVKAWEAKRKLLAAGELDPGVM